MGPVLRESRAGGDVVTPSARVARKSKYAYPDGSPMSKATAKRLAALLWKSINTPKEARHG